MIQGTVLFGAFFIVIVYLIVDICYAFLDPRVIWLLKPPGPRRMPLSRCSRSRPQVHFETEDGLVNAVDGVSYTVDRGQTLGIVGESGSGKSVSSLTVMGLTRSRNARISGEVLFDGKNLLTASDDDMRAIRGDDIAMIFQDPLSSLHPFYKVGDADRGGGARAPRRVQGAGLGPRRRDARAGRHPGAAQARRRPTRTSSRAACASAR